MLNAFSLGPSADLAHVWPLDLVFAALALGGAVYGVLACGRHDPVAWLLPAMLVLPTLMILVVNQVRPAYMNSREVIPFAGAFLLLVGGGLAWLGRRIRFAAPLVAAVLLAGMLYSARDYYFAPQFAKGDQAGMGAYLRDHLQPGDLLLLKPSNLMRLYRYYLPVDALDRAGQAGLTAGYRGLPAVTGVPADQTLLLPGLTAPYRRVWVAEMVNEDDVDRWLGSHLFFLFDRHFENPAFPLKLRLFLANQPVDDQLPTSIQHPTHAAFGPSAGRGDVSGSRDSIRLVGYDVGRPLAPGYQLPVTLYWQAPAKVSRRYKYILRLLPPGGQGTGPFKTEREPYDGALPTDGWPAGKTVVEYSGVAMPKGGIGPGFRLSLQMYDGQTLKKLPVSAVGGASASDPETLLLPLD
jgi:hypothetical protein